MKDHNREIREAQDYATLTKVQKRLMKKMNGLIAEHEAKTGEVICAEFTANHVHFIWDGQMLGITNKR